MNDNINHHYSIRDLLVHQFYYTCITFYRPHYGQDALLKDPERSEIIIQLLKGNGWVGIMNISILIKYLHHWDYSVCPEVSSCTIGTTQCALKCPLAPLGLLSVP